jgi:two-component system response regulator YesN
VAEAVHVSPSHLAHLLRTHVGASYVKYMTLLRMEEGKRLLAETDLKVAAIAGRAGYDDPAYFYRVFRREVGVTPSQYRRRTRMSVGE